MTDQSSKKSQAESFDYKKEIREAKAEILRQKGLIERLEEKLKEQRKTI